MRDKVPKKQKRDKKQVGTSQETKHVTSKLFESDAHVSWGQQMSYMYLVHSRGEVFRTFL